MMASLRLTALFLLPSLGAAPLQNAPLHDMDVIPLASNDRNAVSFDHILETGEIPAYSDDSSYNLSINWGANDLLTSHLEFLKVKLIVEIQTDEEMQALLAQDCWDKPEREAWERALARKVSGVFSELPGLDTYRTIYPDNTPDNERTSTQAEETCRNLNDLVIDIANDSTCLEFDCEHMAILEGCLIQYLENLFLPSAAVPDTGLRHAGRYYYTTGYSLNIEYAIKADADDAFRFGHAYVISAMTGNIIDAVMPGGSHNIYRVPLDEHYSFEDYIGGVVFIDRNIIGSIRAPRIVHEAFLPYGYAGESEIIDARLEAIQNGHTSLLHDLRLAADTDEEMQAALCDLYDEITAAGTTVATGQCTPDCDLP